MEPKLKHILKGRGVAGRVLVYRLGSLGDTIVALPSFRLVREAFPAARVTLLTNEPVHSKATSTATILEGTGLVDDYMEYPVMLRDPVALARLRNRIARKRFDCLVYLTRPRGGTLLSLRDALFFYGCGIFRQIGVPYRANDLYCLPIPGTDRHRHESARLAGNLARLGRPDFEDDHWWDLNLSGAERSEARRLLGPLGVSAPCIAISAGTKMAVKDWTEANWVRLIRKLGERYPAFALVAVGAREEWETSERILAHWGGPTVNLCGTSSPRVSGAVLERATLFIGHDSGPMHLAACVGTRCVAIFSSRNLPGEWYPRGQGHVVLYTKVPCAGCELVQCIEHMKKCIMSISVESVYEAAVAQLTRTVSEIPC